MQNGINGGALNGEQGQVPAGTGFAGEAQREVQEWGGNDRGREYEGIRRTIPSVRITNSGASRPAGQYGIISQEYGGTEYGNEEDAGRGRNHEVVRGTFGKHEIENNTRLKEVALDANGYGTGQENLGEDLRESESGRRIDKAGGNTGAFGDVRYAGVGRPAGSGGIAEIAREYGIETEIVSAEHLAQKGYNQKTGYAKGGKIYVSEQLPEHSYSFRFL